MGIHTPLAGVTFLDHTADVGLQARAPDLEELFRRVARGMVALLQGEDDEERGAGEASGASEERSLTLRADDLPTLVRAWLRELLWWHEVEGLAFRDARFPRLDEHGLEARVTVTPPAGPPVREIKGVTWHGLEARREGDEWRARVIFDV